MIKYFSILLFLSFTARAQPTEIKVKLLKDYYILDGTPLKGGLNCIVITERKAFNKLFGETTRPDTPDFSKELMLVLALPANRKENKLAFEKISMKAGSFIEVYCSIKRNEYPLTYLSYPVVTGVIPKYPEITTINFYNEKGMQKIQSVEIKKKHD